jgi:hypothetical protein
MKLNHLLLCLLMTSGGCYLGPKAEIPSLAYRPAGTTITMETAGGEITGELLAVRPGEFIVLVPRPDRLLIVPTTAIRSGDATLVGMFQAPDLEGGTLERLRRVSRYPQGIDEELEGSLLRGYGLARMERVDP